MTQLNIIEIKKSLLDITQYQINFVNGEFFPSIAMGKEISKILDTGNKFVVFYGINKLFKKYELSIESNIEKAYSLYERIFDDAMSHINLDSYNIINKKFNIAKMDVDGYNVNQKFSHDGKVAGRDFITTKCLHFDAATPFIANIYGLNKNIENGFPVICDTHKYCKDKNVAPSSIVTNIPDNYNIAIKEQYYYELLKDYSFYIKLDFLSDIVMVMLSNEIKFGLAHGATPPSKIDTSQPSYRPIRHLEFQYYSEQDYSEWLKFYGVEESIGRDYDGLVNLTLDYYEQKIYSLDTFIEVDNTLKF